MVQPKHRSDPVLGRLIRGRPAAAAAAEPAPDTLHDRGLAVLITQATTVQPGQQLRAAICPLCGLIVSDQECRIVSCVATILHSDGRGDLLTRAFLAHAHHWPVTDEELNAAAHRITCQGCSNGAHP